MVTWEMLPFIDGWNICSFIHTMFRLLLFVPSLPGPRVIATLVARPRQHFNFFLFSLVVHSWIFTVIHHRHTRVCSGISNYLVAIFFYAIFGWLYDWLVMPGSGQKTTLPTRWRSSCNFFSSPIPSISYDIPPLGRTFIIISRTVRRNP